MAKWRQLPYNSDDWQVEDDIAIKVEIGLNAHNRNYRILRLPTESQKIAIELLVLTTLSIGI